jgi:hypothetical protein
LGFEDDHVPPEVELDKVVVEPAQIDVAPEIGERFVRGFTDNILVVELVHP